MANLYVYLDKRSPRKDGSGTLRLALTHKHSTVYESLDIHVKPEEWDASKCQIVQRPDKKFQNVFLRKALSDSALALARVEQRDDFKELTAREILTMITRGTRCVDHNEDTDYVMNVYKEYMMTCRKASTMACYRASLNNLIEYEQDIDTLRFKDINVAWLRRYQNWLTGVKGMETNGANVYLRNLRTVFNYAIHSEFTNARYPFRDIDMSTTEPDKRTIPYDKFVEWVTYPLEDGRAFYRDLFMLSFYLCGIRPVDLLSVKKSQVVDGRLVYYPEKLNGRTKLSIKIEPEAWEIIHKYEGKELLLNVMESRTDRVAFLRHWNAALRAIGPDEVEEVKGRNGRTYYNVRHRGIINWITVYYARTSWATYAYNVMDLPMDVISQALGHKSGLKVTNFYVKRDGTKVDKSNRAMIDKLKEDIANFVKKNEENFCSQNEGLDGSE